MLPTLISLSGFYGISNMILVKRNKNLLKNNIFLSLKGRKTLDQITIIKDSIPYRINYIKSDKLSINNFLLVDEDKTYQTTKFNTTEECKNFCMNNNLVFDNSIYEKIVIDDKNLDNIWVLRHSEKYTIMKKMNSDDFKNHILKTNQLPLNKLNIILFMILIIIYYESNYYRL